tara:strand:+ start:327 stop:824 length:498 start_codon:yes stop_codon:yes gene_type:complete
MKEAIEEFFQKETNRYDTISKLDLNGARFTDLFSKYLDEKVSRIMSEQDQNAQGDLILDFLQNVKEQMLETMRKINHDRENLRHKVLGIKESYHYVDSYKNRKAQEEKLKKESLEDKEELLDEIKSKISEGIDPEKEKRKIGTRPEKIKNIRKVKSKMSGSKKST